MRLVVLDKSLKFYLTYIDEDEDKIELHTHTEHLDKTRGIIVRLLKTGWVLKDRKEEDISTKEKENRLFIFIFEKSQMRKDLEKELNSNKLFKDYKKNPYDERIDNQFLISLGKYIKTTFNKYSIFEKEDFCDTILRMDNYMKDFLMCNDFDKFKILKETILDKHKYLKEEIKDVK